MPDTRAAQGRNLFSACTLAKKSAPRLQGRLVPRQFQLAKVAARRYLTPGAVARKVIMKELESAVELEEER